jgi:hypothetical protein
MKKLPLANRTRECNLFEHMVKGETAERILLIQAESGFGKTDLLTHFRRLVPAGVLQAFIDCKGANSRIPYVFERAARDLGEPRFPRLSTTSSEVANGPGINISDNRTFGAQTINIHVHGDPQVQEYQLARLHHAFFEDIKALAAPVVIILDTFNEAGDIVKTWIASDFLADAMQVPNLVVVVAGQDVPDPGGGWADYHEQCHLEGIKDVEAWHACVQAAGWPVEKDWIAAFCWHCKGKPKDIAIILRQRALEMGI